MFEPTPRPSPTTQRRLPHGAPPLEAAKWPPDDDDLPAGPPPDPGVPAGGGGGANFGDETEFKKGTAKIWIFLGLLAIAGAAAVYFGVRQQSEKLTVDQIAKIKKDIFVLPKKEQIPKWRDWATKTEPFSLQQEALMQLAWADDPEGVGFATKALAQADHRIRGVAAQVLSHYGLPAAEGSKPALLAALKTADASDEPQITWALVQLNEPAVFDKAMELYRKGHLTKVERLGGGPAFNHELLSKLVSLDKLASLAGDPSDSVRQLVASVLSAHAEAKWTPVLTKLVVDPVVEVAREAANGLGRIADESARAPLLEALSKADKDSRQKFLEALRDGIGGVGLVLALESCAVEPAERSFFQHEQIFKMLEGLADPRAGDALVKWVETKNPAIHWKTEAALRLAEIGDVRGAKYLGERMRLDPTKIYNQNLLHEVNLTRTDDERVVGARMLADLAVLHPDKHDQLRADAEDGVIFWIHDRPQPHANGLRFLAAVKSTKDIKALRDWAFPKDELPKEGQQPPFPQAFETAQSALRYIGWLKDQESWQKLLDQFDRKKDKKMDITQAGLEGAGLAMLGMALRAVAYGAAQGLAHWGDPKAYDKLIEHIEDMTWHEEARLESCLALPWLADEKQMGEIAKKAIEFAGDTKDVRKRWIGSCYAEALARRPVPGAAPQLVDLITPEAEPGVRNRIARAVGIGGFDEAIAPKLFEKLNNVDTRNDAALALILGGSADVASRTVAMYTDFDPHALEDLKQQYYFAFGYWSDEDVAKGKLYRWVENAEAIARVRIQEHPQEWARIQLSRQFDNLKFDNGPRSMTRVVLRHRLLDAARKGDAAARAGAIRTLKFMKEQGSLMALRHEPGEVGQLAGKAFFELMNPKALSPADAASLRKQEEAAAAARGE